MQAINQYKNLNPSVYYLFAARLINRMGDFVQFLLVLLLTVKLGMGNTTVSLVVTAMMVATCIGQLLGGIIADRICRKYVLLACQFAVSFAYMLCAILFATNQYHWVPLAIIVSSPFRGATAPVSNALVADFSEPQDRSKSFSLLYLGTNIGVAVGPMLASFLFQRSLVGLFVVSSLLMVISSVVLLLHLPVISPKVLRGSQNKGNPFGLLKENPMLVGYLFLSFLYAFCYAQGSFALPLQFVKEFGEKEGPVGYGYLMTINALTVVLCTALVTQLGDKYSHFANLRLAMGFFALGFGIYAFSQGMLVFFFATFIWTIGEILMATNGNVILNSYAPVSSRGLFNSISILIGGIGQSFSPLIGSVLITQGSYQLLWLVMSSLLVFLSLYIFLLEKKFNN
ncbi:MAG: MFS transporter [Sphaerochaetaceae bacterium]